MVGHWIIIIYYNMKYLYVNILLFWPYCDNVGGFSKKYYYVSDYECGEETIRLSKILCKNTINIVHVVYSFKTLIFRPDWLEKMFLDYCRQLFVKNKKKTKRWCVGFITIGFWIANSVQWVNRDLYYTTLPVSRIPFGIVFRLQRFIVAFGTRTKSRTFSTRRLGQ